MGSLKAPSSELVHIQSSFLKSDEQPAGLAVWVHSVYATNVLSIWILALRGSLINSENPPNSLF